MTLHVRYTFWYISFLSSAKQQREMTSLQFFFWRTGTHEGEFFFSYWTWAPSLRIQFPDSSKAHRMKMNNISSKPEMAEVSACADVLPRCPSSPGLTCDQALFSFRSVKHSGGTGETKNRAWYNSSTERLPPTFLIDWHSTKQPIKISSACTILGMQISHNGNSQKVTQMSAK